MHLPHSRIRVQEFQRVALVWLCSWLVVMNVVRLGGLLTVLALGACLLVMFRRDRRAARLQPVRGEDSVHVG